MLTPAQIFMASTAVRELRVALSNTFLYASGNSMVGQSIDRFLKSLEGLFVTFPSVTLGESEGRLVMESTPLNEKTTGSTNMLKDLFVSHKLHSLTFFPGVTAQELTTLFDLLKPKGLPTGLSLSQALVQASLSHVKANEKVFVAIQEGEKVVSASEAVRGVEPGEENLQEALEALQYFLQIFTKVRPDNNKREVARRMVEKMGGWLASSGNPSPSAGQGWREVLGGFQSLRESLGKPSQLKDAQTGLEDLMRKLVTLGEAAGYSPEGPTGPPADPSRGGEAGGNQESLFESDPILSAIASGKWEVFWDPSLEEQAAKALPTLQAPERAESFKDLWKILWKQTRSREWALPVLRHLNRLQWNKLPRPLQQEGLQEMRALLEDTQDPEVYAFALSLAQDWLPQELSKPDWKQVRDTTAVLKGLAADRHPKFPKQTLAAGVALETIFCDPVLASLLSRWEKDGPGGGEIVSLLALLGEEASQYLFGLVEAESPGSTLWEKAVDLISALQVSGAPLYENWLGHQENQGKLEKFLEIFTRVPIHPSVADHLERHWNSLPDQVQLKVLGLVARWERADFRPLLLNLLRSPEKAQALAALGVLAKVGMEGDSLPIIKTVQGYPAHAKGREIFWIAACHALGELGDPTCLPVLKEWADKYKFMENKKERTLEVRRAAIEALVHFEASEFRTFLEGLRAEGEKDLLPALEKALHP